jgi:pyruvate formate lyase activating enzyme
MTGGKVARFWRRDGDRVLCELCPHRCRLAEGERGRCFVRLNHLGQLWLITWGRSSGFCIDPIEKKPLHHFLPGTPVLSFGTAGCNLNCRFCQNWELSKARENEILAVQAEPEAIARAAVKYRCRSVAYTYNDPVIFHEYAIETAIACREIGIRSVAVTAGYQLAEPRREFFRHMDGANVDLKSFNDDFYRRLTGARLAPVLETLEYIAGETDVWLEVTTLLIPGENDSTGEIELLTQWVAEKLGRFTPLHFSAFHPTFRMPHHLQTPVETLRRAREIALEAGLAHVYTGNVHDPAGGSTLCHVCGDLLIERDWYQLGSWGIKPDGTCRGCAEPVAGIFESRPGNWGARSQQVHMGET